MLPIHYNITAQQAKQSFCDIAGNTAKSKQPLPKATDLEIVSDKEESNGNSTYQKVMPDRMLQIKGFALLH